MKLKLLFLLAISIVLQHQFLSAQGCVAVRQMGGLNMCSSNSYNLNKHEIQLGLNYRYFHSWRHFVGTEEQPQRQTTGGGHDANGNDRGNAVNIYSHALDFNFSLGLTSRLQLNATIPYVNNERSQVLRQTSPVKDTFRYSVFASGIGDFRIGLNYWIFNPEKAGRGNIMLGLGVKLPTGRYDDTDNDVPQADGSKLDFVVMDQAIQPGDGGTGISIELQGFRQIFKNIYGFANGYYLFNPKLNNGTYKSDPNLIVKNPLDTKSNLDTFYNYNLYACPDQYFVRAGLMTSFLKNNNLTVSLAARWEGIPAYDAFGGQDAYRRPGYVVSVEPGIAYRLGNHNFSLYVPKNFIRNRIQSANDITSENLQRTLKPDAEVHGDAAFADYSISFGYAYRFHKM